MLGHCLFLWNTFVYFSVLLGTVTLIRTDFVFQFLIIHLSVPQTCKFLDLSWLKMSLLFWWSIVIVVGGGGGGGAGGGGCSSGTPTSKSSCIYHSQTIIAIIWVPTLNARTRVLLGKLTITQVFKTSLTFMEPTGSIPCSQQSTFWVINKYSRKSFGPQNIHDVTHESRCTYTHLHLHTAYICPSHLQLAGQIFSTQTISGRLQNSSRWWGSADKLLKRCIWFKSVNWQTSM
jgi:tellurite resistance-related uncharacterized protein